MVFFPGVVNSRQTLTMGDLGEEATTHTRNSSSTSQVSITINVPVVYMGRYEVVLSGDYP
jgi:hypothetical protein